MEAPTVLLVHSPFVGPMSWEPTAEKMRARGRRVVLPSLLGAATSTPADASMADAVRVALEGPDVERVVVVAHSRAGTLVPSIVERLPDRVEGIVFVDATLPHPGRAWFDIAPPEAVTQLRGLVDSDGLLPPWNEWFPAELIHDLVPEQALRERLIAETPRLPLDFCAETAPAFETWATLPCGYLRLSAAYEATAELAHARGWAVAHHLSTVTDPRSVTDAVLGLLELPRRPATRCPWPDRQ